MNGISSEPGVNRNPLTHKQHRREALWQITVPILAGAVILLVLSVLATGMQMGEISRWADISLIWLIPPVMAATLLSLLILAGSIYATIRLIQALPTYSYKLLAWLLVFGLNIRRVNDRIIEPFLRVQMLSASMKSLRRRASRQ